MTRALSFFIFLSLSIAAHAADLLVSGTVFEKGTRKALEGVTVSVAEATASRATTDAQGKFSLALPASGNYTLSAARSGAYNTGTLALQISQDQPSPALEFYLMPISTLSEIVVVSERSPDRVSKSIISGKQLKKIPGTSGDPLKGLQALPGVVAAGGGQQPAVRGSGANENAYYVDDIPIGKIFYFQGISVFNADLISDFNLYSAAFSPHYKDVTGAVFDVALRSPRTDRLGTKLNVNIQGADVLVEGPVNANQSFYMAARRSYADLLVKQIAQNGITIQVPNYYDYQGKYIWKLGDTDKLTFHLLGSRDELKLNVGGSSDFAKQQPVLAGDIALSNAYTMQAAVWDSVMFDQVVNKLAVVHNTLDNSNSVASAGRIALVQNELMLREHAIIPLNDSHELSLASNFSQQQFQVNADLKSCNSTSNNTPGTCDLTSLTNRQYVDTFTIHNWDVSAQDRKRIEQTLTLVTGLRHSAEDFLNRSYTEPRIGLEWEYTQQTLFTAGWGRHNQLPPANQISKNFGNPELDHLRADHSVLGVAHKLDAMWSWKAETYYKKFSNLVVGVPDPAINYLNGASGQAYGLELLVKKDSNEKLNGWFALSLARSTRRNDLTGESFRFELDQPVNAKLVTSYQLTEDWGLGARWEAHSGTPYTPVLGTSGTYADGRPIPVYATINSGTLPIYHRLDFRFDRVVVKNTYKLNWYIELNNVYFHQNVVGYTYDPTYTKKSAIYPFVLPISFGVQAEF